MFTYLHKYLKEASFCLGTFNFTYIISLNIYKKIIKNVPNDEMCNYANVKTNSQSFSD